MRPWQLVFVAALLVGVGCDSSPTPEYRSASKPNPDAAFGGPHPADEAPAAPPAGQDRQPLAKKGAEKAAVPAAGERGPAQAPNAPAGPVSRKIVYNANVGLVVSDIDKAEGDLKAVVKDLDAFIASSEMTGSVGSPRSGHWRVRVPVDRFDSFMTAVVKLGVPERNKADSQDVTDEYYDLEDRIKNKKLEQETLRGYLQEKKATSKLEEILTIEKELSRVRGELDQMEGKLRRLKDLSSLATVDVAMREVKDYEPPQAPTFGGSVRGTFSHSIDLLVRFGQGVVIVAVALAPWLAALAAIAVPGWGIGRRYWKKLRPAPLAAQPGERPV
jgi:hypothetical protein